MTLEIGLHKNILLRILKEVYTENSLGPFLGFKGGTAAYLFYGLPRFSVDLDFDLLDENKVETVFTEANKILKGYGVVKEARKKRFNLFFILTYENKIPGAQNVKLEINRREFGSRYEVKSHLGISMKVMAQEDMFAHKLAALFERFGKTNRDIYDVWYFLKNNWPVNKDLLEKRTGMSMDLFLKECAVLLGKMNKRNILGGMGELLDEKQKSWVKKHLLEDVIFLLNLKLNEGRESASL